AIGRKKRSAADPGTPFHTAAIAPATRTTSSITWAYANATTRRTRRPHHTEINASATATVAPTRVPVLTIGTSWTGPKTRVARMAARKTVAMERRPINATPSRSRSSDSRTLTAVAPGSRSATLDRTASAGRPALGAAAEGAVATGSDGEDAAVAPGAGKL